MTKRVQTERFSFRKRALANHVGALPVLIAVNQHHELSGADKSKGLRRVALLLWNTKPNDINRSAQVHDFQPGALTHDGTKLLVANRLEDTLSVIDIKADRVVSTIPLDGPKRLSVLRKGEQTFYTAHYSFQSQIGCANCHIDSTFDGLQWDLEPDGFGRDIVDNRPIEAVKDTEPYKWNGGNPDLPTECGPRTEKYFWRSQNYSNRELTDLVLYVRSLPPRPLGQHLMLQNGLPERGLERIWLRHFLIIFRGKDEPLVPRIVVIAQRFVMPDDLHVVNASNQNFGRACLAAAAKWRFRPGVVRGRQVRTHISPGDWNSAPAG